jgi:hypothetical protein
MNQAFRFIIFLVVIFTFIFLVSLLLPSKVTITKSVLINASIEKVQNQLIHFDQWKNWYPAFKNENVTITIIKNPSNTNSVSLTNNRGKSVELTITQSNPYTISVHVHSSSSRKMAYEFILTPKAGNKIQLTWNINAQLGWYPWNRIWGIFLDKVSGSQYELALEDLKKVAEN